MNASIREVCLIILCSTNAPAHEVSVDYLLYGRFYVPTGRLDAIYSTRISPTLQTVVAAISDPPSTPKANIRGRGDASNVMIHLQHDVGKWCTEYSWSAEDAMWGVNMLYNFGRLGVAPDPTDETDKASRNNVGIKRVDEEEPVEGGLKGRLSAGAEFYFSAKERSAGGQSFPSCLLVPCMSTTVV